MINDFITEVSYLFVEISPYLILGFIISGFTESFGQGFYDIWIIKTDDNGNEIYTQTFGGNMDDRALGGDKGSNGEPLIIGYTSSFGNGGEDILFIKIDPNYQP